MREDTPPTAARGAAPYARIPGEPSGSRGPYSRSMRRRTHLPLAALLLAATATLAGCCTRNRDFLAWSLSPVDSHDATWRRNAVAIEDVLIPCADEDELLAQTR